MKTEELEKIFEYLINEDNNGLIFYCHELEIVPTEETDIEVIYNELAKLIEKDDDFMLYYKEYAKENEETHVLIPYFQKPENIRYFQEDQGNISIRKELTNSVEERIKNNRNDKKEEIEEQNAKISSHLKKYGLLYVLILEIIALIIAFDAFKPFIETHIIKIANITDSTIISEEKDTSFTNYFTTDINITYSYNVDEIEYTNEEHTFLVGTTSMKSSQNTIQIYYNKKNPSKSKVYKRYGKILKILILIGNFILIIGIIEFAKLRKNIKQ